MSAEAFKEHLKKIQSKPVDSEKIAEKERITLKRVADKAMDLAGRTREDIKQARSLRVIRAEEDYSCRRCGEVYRPGDRIYLSQGLPVCPYCGGQLKVGD